MLNVNPNKRITAEQISNHAWIEQNTSDNYNHDVDDCHKLDSEIISNL